MSDIPPGNPSRQITAAYRELFPDIPEDELNERVKWWWQQENDTGRFILGYPDYRLRPAMIMLVEAAYACCYCAPPARIRQIAQAAIRELSGI